MRNSFIEGVNRTWANFVFTNWPSKRWLFDLLKKPFEGPVDEHCNESALKWVRFKIFTTIKGALN